MNVALEALILIFLFLAFILSFKLQKIKKELVKLKEQGVAGSERLILYEEAIKKAPVKKFFEILNFTRTESLTPDMQVLMIYYLQKALINLRPRQIPFFLSDLKANKHSDFLKIAFIKAIELMELFILGEALFSAIKEGYEQRAEIINNFLDEMPSEFKIAQLSCTSHLLSQYINYELIDLPSEYRQKAEAELLKLENMVQKNINT